MDGELQAPLLDRDGFRGRLFEEVARVRRSGGFLSLAALGDSRADDGWAGRAADRLRMRVRAHDVLGVDQPRLLVLLPDTDRMQARRAGERFLRILGEGRPGEAASVGLATTYGEIEGGGDALLDAVERALQEAPAGEVRASDWPSGKPRVLIVDDDVDLATTLAETISDLGWEGMPCSHVPDALQRIREAQYSALFVDLVLPGASGVDLLRVALARNPKLPAILMSGRDADADVVVTALGLGPVMFVEKPISPEHLQSSLALFRGLLPGAPKR
jgi:CheY-like chemotaxis protein